MLIKFLHDKGNSRKQGKNNFNYQPSVGYLLQMFSHIILKSSLSIHEQFFLLSKTRQLH